MVAVAILIALILLMISWGELKEADVILLQKLQLVTCLFLKKVISTYLIVVPSVLASLEGWGRETGMPDMSGLTYSQFSKIMFSISLTYLMLFFATESGTVTFIEKIRKNVFKTSRKKFNVYAGASERLEATVMVWVIAFIVLVWELIANVDILFHSALGSALVALASVQIFFKLSVSLCKIYFFE